MNILLFLFHIDSTNKNETKCGSTVLMTNENCWRFPLASSLKITTLSHIYNILGYDKPLLSCM